MKKPKIHSTLISQTLILRVTLALFFVIPVSESFSQATTIKYIKLKKRNADVSDIYPFISTFEAPPRLDDSGKKMALRFSDGFSDRNEIYIKNSDGEWLFLEDLPFDTEKFIHFDNDLAVIKQSLFTYRYYKRENGFWAKPKRLDSVGYCFEEYIHQQGINSIVNKIKGHKYAEDFGIALSADLNNYYYSIGTKWWNAGLLKNLKEKNHPTDSDSLTSFKIHFSGKGSASKQSCQQLHPDGIENEKWPYLLQDKITLLFTKEIVEWDNGKEVGYKNRQYVTRKLSNGTWSVPKEMPDANLDISWFNRTYDTAYFFERSAYRHSTKGRIGYAVYPGGLFEPLTDQKTLPEKSPGKKEQKNASTASSKDIAGEATPERKIALVIGVKSYKHVQPLLNSLNDAHDIAASLKAKGFRVMELYDPSSKRQMQDTIRKYFNVLNGQRNMAGLFFYSGHGLQVDGSNYLIPTTANPVLKADIDDQCLKMDYVMATLEQAGNPLNIFIMDACRNNPFRSFTRSTEPGLSQVNAPNGSYVVYATSPGKVASDGVGRNGLFTSKLLKHMDTPGLNIEQVFKLVARDVSTESNGVQLPWLSQSYFGDFYFSEKPSVK